MIEIIVLPPPPLSLFLRDRQQAGAAVMEATKATSFSHALNSVPFFFQSVISHHIDPP